MLFRLFGELPSCQSPTFGYYLSFLNQRNGKAPYTIFPCRNDIIINMIKEYFASTTSTKARLIILLKMIVGFVLGILIADLFRLDYIYTAGVITVLSLEPTRKKSIRVAIIRLIDSVLALGLASLLFIWLRYNFWVLIIFIVVLVTISFSLKIESGLVVALVLVSQIYIEQDYRFALNASYILLIGIGVAFLLNLYMPKHDRQINQSIHAIDTEISSLIQAMAENENVDFSHVKSLLIDARGSLFYDLENHYFVQTDQRAAYLEMRNGQTAILERVQSILVQVADIPEKRTVQSYLKSFRGKIGTANYAVEMKASIDQLFSDFKVSPLPTDRTAFEYRAELYHILLEIAEFLKLKINYHEQYK